MKAMQILKEKRLQKRKTKLLLRLPMSLLQGKPEGGGVCLGEIPTLEDRDARWLGREGFNVRLLEAQALLQAQVPPRRGTRAQIPSRSRQKTRSRPRRGVRPPSPAAQLAQARAPLGRRGPAPPLPARGRYTTRPTARRRLALPVGWEAAAADWRAPARCRASAPSIGRTPRNNCARRPASAPRLAAALTGRPI